MLAAFKTNVLDDSRVTCKEVTDHVRFGHAYTFFGDVGHGFGIVTVAAPDLYAFRKGELVQNAFPYLSHDAREWIINGTGMPNMGGGDNLQLPDRFPTVGEIVKVGSRTIPGASANDSDYDWLILLGRWDMGKAFSQLTANGWERGGSYPGMHFNSFRRGNQNMILTADARFYDAFKSANHVAVRLGLTKKTDRIALFQACLYGNCWNDTPKHREMHDEILSDPLDIDDPFSEWSSL